MSFQPPHCPYDHCPSRAQASPRVPFLWRRRGRFTRLCDGRSVPRFTCLTCRRGFSSQTFRVDYRLRLPRLHLDLFGLLISKVSLRQSARVLHTRRRTIEHRQLLLGHHARAFQLQQVARRGGRPLPGGVYLLDEMETFEESRKVQPVTVPMLVERESYFVVDVRTATLPARGRLTPEELARKRLLELREGRRRNRSSEAVRGCLQTLAAQLEPSARVAIVSDEKSSYPRLIEQVLGPRTGHEKVSSRRKKTVFHPLFRLHVCQAMLRDGLSRMVRRNWSHSRRRARLEVASWIWVAWRNWIRYRTNRDRGVTPAMVLGLTRGFWSVAELFRWRVFAGVA
jgi:transposase-like protein